MCYQRYILLVLYLMGTIHLVSSQSRLGTIQGTIFLENGAPIAAATIVELSSAKRVVADRQGRYAFSLPENKKYILQVSCLGNVTQTKSVLLKKGEVLTADFVLKASNKQLTEVTIDVENVNLRARKEVVKAEIVDTKAAQAKSTTLVELMNRSAGLRVRQSGGLGANTNIMVNGFQGKSVKILKDGIPTDYLGASFNISATPVNMLERVEVYKGVLPTEIGADALGGAINMVSRVERKRSLALSYEIGSFQTHRASINLRDQQAEKNFFWGIDAFYNYAKNNYSVTASIPDLDKATVSNQKVTLFHNKFKQIYGEVYAGLKNLSWADEIKLGITTFDIQRDNQFGSLMETPFGASISTERAPVIPSIRYKKEFLDKRLSIDQFIVYSTIHGTQTDTLQGAYDWYGNFHPSTDPTNRGEAENPTQATHTYTNFTSRTGLQYSLSHQHNLALNLVFNDYSRSGRDPYGTTTAGENPVDLQTLPANYRKLIASLGLKSNFLASRLQNLFQVKYFTAHTKGQEVSVNTGYLNETTSSAQISKFGLAEALKFNFSKRTYLRVSGELATRLPDQVEILGNGAFILANFAIQPETSSNGNIGFHTATKNDKLAVELNSFYRITKNMIITAPVNLLYSQSINVESVKGIGFEIDMRYQPASWLTLNANSTYQDFRLFKLSNPLIDYLEGARLRNTPYFFSNLGANVQLQDVIAKTDRLQGYYQLSYVHQYYLNYIPKNTEPAGFLGLWGASKVDAPNIIPSQAVHTIGVLWQPKDALPWTLNIACKNLLDADVYDNFKIQNAGRSFHIKLNYTLPY